ncbi:glycosyltransferase family 4 protein [Sphingomonas sp. LB-2]|uniref:glycosyltransferase family 4 protein n=1 Tax=Sphingomonas caeni TaxID=2984949 RepID=UPI0022305C79|nr:glycosyltransferase family 4 protein [Sphingomonas caeni]MCW3849349.1 glycosyltransferase family 4 protein [Sphingomonas caeni]
MIRVGYTQRHYAAARNFVEAQTPGVELVRAGNVFRYPDYALFKAFGHVDPLLGNLHWGGGGVDLLHFFNTMSLGRTPWVTTFETILPRWTETRGWAVRPGLRLLAGKPCRRLIALSQCAADFQRGFLADTPDMAEAIRAKVTVLHPPQRLLADAPAAAEATIRLAIVGADFFRKGGREVLRAVDRLLAEGAPLHLTIVSTMAIGDYATHATAEDLAEARRVIAKWPGAIERIARLSNDAVLDLFRRSHVALLPTWAETYGYSVLEAQAAGCPVLTTDIRALTEINDDAAGWVIAVPKLANGNGVIGTAAERAVFAELLEAGIEAKLRAILTDPGVIAAKGAASLARIRAQHDPAAHGERLAEIYREALT